VENVAEIHERMIRYMSSYKPSEFQAEVLIDAVLDSFEEISISMVRYLENIMEPTGNGNEIPKILINGVKVVNCRIIGKTNDHILMNVSKGSREVTVIGWSWAERMRPLIPEFNKTHLMLDMVVFPEINKYQGNEEIRLILVDFRLPK